MHPILIGSPDGFAIRSYGFMLALSFMIGIWLATRRAKKIGVDPNQIMDLSIWIIIAAIVGSRLLYVIYHLDEFKGRWTATFNPFQGGQVGIGGLTMLGGVVLAIITAYFYMRRKKMSFLLTADVMIPSLALGIFLTRIGCFLNGCCYGLKTDLPWGVTFTNEYCAVANEFMNVPLHPTQLYAAFYGLLILGVVLFAEKYKKFDGMLFFIFLIFYGLSRFLVEFVRYQDNYFAIIGGVKITINQVISLLMIIAGAAFLVIKNNKIKKSKKV
ncbi:prolipoprotein diacylglyceryl transferase [candidate division KSB1 bacterium]|nr:prolipoprotein diacylglyceryl transferase [candidate division KSB1 bacterium]